MDISFVEKLKRKNAVDFVIANSRLEGLEHYRIIEHLYEQYITGQIDMKQLVELGIDFMDQRLKYYNVS